MNTTDGKQFLVWLCKQPVSSEKWFTKALTLLSICPKDTSVIDFILSAVDSNNFRLDGNLFLSLLTKSQGTARNCILQSCAFGRLPKSAFKKAFSYCEEHFQTTQERLLLAFVLRVYLRRESKGADHFSEFIRSTLVSRSPALRLHGLALIGFMTHVNVGDIINLRKALDAKNFELRMNSLNSICLLLKRHKEIKSNIVRSCLDEVLKIRVLQILRADPEKNVRACARYVLQERKKAADSFKNAVSE